MAALEAAIEDRLSAIIGWPGKPGHDHLGFIYRSTDATAALRRPGQAKREPGSQKRWALQFVRIPDKALPFREDGGGDPLARQANSALFGESPEPEERRLQAWTSHGRP